jgi:hypothetical protein
MTCINIVSGAVYTRKLGIKDRIQIYGMAAVFLVVLYNSPAGLVLYWTMNNVFSLFKNGYAAVSFKQKRAVLYAGISALGLLLSYYSFFIHHGNIRVRILIVVLALLTGVFPWIVPALAKLIKRIKIVQWDSTKPFTLFLLSFVTVWILLGAVIPAMLIASSPQEFSYIDSYTTPLFFIENTMLQCAGLFLFWPLCLYFLFPARIKKAFSFFAMLLCLLMITNTFMFRGNYGLISINLIFSGSVSHNLKEIAFNIFIIILLLCGVSVLYFLKQQKIISTALGLCVFALAGLSVINISKIQKEYNNINPSFANHNDKPNDLLKPIFTLSETGSNVVVIMLDRAISVFVPYILEESPELRDIYSGFVYYPNTVSFNGYTGIGAPPLYGGYEYTPEDINKRDNIPLVTKHNEALTMLPRIFSENGFNVTVTDQPYANYSQKIDISIYDEYPEINAYVTDSAYTDIWLKEHDLYLPSTSDILKRNILYYSIFRGLPLAFREALYAKGDWCASVHGNSLRLTLNGYAVLDYLPQLTTIEKDTNCLLLLTNNTTHEVSLLQAPEYRPSLLVTNYGTSKFNKESAYHVNAASLKRLADWFLFLKEKGIYDNTKIILVSDHGSEPNFTINIGLPFNVEQFNPLLMIKDFNASGEIKTDMSFMSNADVPYFALKDTITEMKNPFTGQTITIDRKNEPLYIAISGSIHIGNKTATQYVLNSSHDYYVRDNIFDSANWNRADK